MASDGAGPRVRFGRMLSSWCLGASDLGCTLRIEARPASLPAHVLSVMVCHDGYASTLVKGCCHCGLRPSASPIKAITLC